METMNIDLRRAQTLLFWYDNAVRAFLEKTISEEKLTELDRDRRRLVELLEKSNGEVSVCFLGPSGIGKSTLINSIVGGAQSVVPSGGIGPLTAQALVVRNHSVRGLEVEYHGAGQLYRTIFGLEKMFKGELGSPANEDVLPELEGLEENELPEDRNTTADGDQADLEAQPDSERNDRREQLRRSAQLLVTGSQDQDRDLRYLLDTLREAIGGKRIWGTAPKSEDSDRITGIQKALLFAKSGKKFELNGSASDEEFRETLQAHATGYLAPLIKNLTLNWPSTNLKHGITLVDLPGVGVVRDVHVDVTRKWVREKAQALVLVVDHRGMTEPLAEALRRSEFLNSLIYSADEPDDDPIVLVAATRIDDVASERYRQDIARSKRKAEHFREVVDEAKERLKTELQHRLEEVWLNETDANEARKQVVRNLIDRLQVHPLSAPEYVKLIAEDEDDPPFLKQIDQTGVPGLIESLEVLAEARRERATARLEEGVAGFHERLMTTLRLIEAQWETDSRAEEEAEQLRRDLEVFIQPRREELSNRQGAYRNFLKHTIPQRVEDLVSGAKAKASRDIDRFLKKLGHAHWATLRASVRRGGRYSGALNINLPLEFALRFEEPIAEMWGKEILKDIRKQTKDYADDCVALVEQVTDWALEQGARVQPRIVEAQRDAIRADAKNLQNVGREMVKEMRDEAKAHLISVIEGPIKKECEGFVRKNLDVGPGVMQRILELYEQLADKVTEAAEAPAKKILLKLFREVEKEILDAFAAHQDPLKSVFEAIVTSQQKYRERSDAQKRKRILAELKEVLDLAPEALETIDVQRGPVNVV
jgi:GTP-binding protein EngB required for normal cell division